MERIFGLDLQLLQDVLLTAVAIFILFFVLSYLLFNPVREMLEKRKKKISDELSEAEKSLREAEAMKSEYDAKMLSAKDEANAILDEARKKALRSRNEILEGARDDATRLKARAAAEIEQEKVHARDDLKNEMVDIAALLAEKAVLGKMTPEIQENLVDETLQEIGEHTWQDQ
jgi:F-type H+-transporting ATPase subunit b